MMKDCKGLPTGVVNDFSKTSAYALHGISGFEVQKGKPTADFTAVNDGNKGRTVTASLNADQISTLIATGKLYNALCSEHNVPESATQKNARVKRIHLFEGALTALNAVNP